MSRIVDGARNFAGLKRILALLLLLVPCAAALGQRTGEAGASLRGSRKNYQDTVWTVRGLTPLDNRFRKWKVDLSLDARQTLVSDTRVRLAGIRFAVEHRRVHRFGIGVYTLGDGVRVKTLTEVDPRISDATLTLAYSSLFYERVMFFSRKWEWSLTGHIGSGQITGRYVLDGEAQEYRQTVRPLEGSTTLFYHLTYFMSVGTGVGYRYMRSTPAEIRPLYNAPVAILRVRIKLIRMTAGIFNKDIRRSY